MTVAHKKLQRCQYSVKGSKYPWLLHWPLALKLTLPRSTTHVIPHPYGANSLGHETRDRLSYVFLVYKTSWWTCKEMTVETTWCEATNKTWKKYCSIYQNELHHTESYPVFPHNSRTTPHCFLPPLWRDVRAEFAPVRKANMNVSLPTPWRLK